MRVDRAKIWMMGLLTASLMTVASLSATGQNTSADSIADSQLRTNTHSRAALTFVMGGATACIADCASGLRLSCGAFEGQSCTAEDGVGCTINDELTGEVLESSDCPMALAPAG